MSYLSILERLDIESRYQDTLKLLAEFIEDTPQYNSESWTALVDAYRDDRIFIDFMFTPPSEEVRRVRVVYDFYDCGYKIYDGDERAVVSHITGNPYLDMWAIYQEIRKMVY